MPPKYKPFLSVVLVRPIYPRNVGMCARSLANMGGGDLIVIAPQCTLDDQAKEGAAGAQDQLRTARVYASFDDFFASEPDGLRIALSARDLRSNAAEFLDARLSSVEAHAKFDRVYLIFGPEDDGLSHSDLTLVHHVCRLPTFGEFTSLNLSHAVLLSCYLFGAQFVGRETYPMVKSPSAQYFPQKTIHDWLAALGFRLDSPYVNAEKTLNRILLENEPSVDELRVLESILQQTIRKLKSSSPHSD